MRSFIIMLYLCYGSFSLGKLETSRESDTKNVVNPECFMNVTEIIHYHGYPSEEHHVETKDGYIITVYRIPHGRNDSADKGQRPVAVLQHALLGDASHWISNLPKNSLGFLLADHHYDVWLVNSRGNTWSRRHKTLKTREEEFWKFSFHEMGYYDIPAVLYFILNKTGQEQLYYVGHSEGTAIGFVAFSSWPELAKRIKVFFALGPVATITFSTTPLLTLLPPPGLLQVLFGYKGFLQYPTILRTLFVKICNFQPEFCASVVSFIAGYNTPNWNMNRTDVYVAHSPAGTSVQNVLHWKQIYQAKQFQAYDYGSKEKNMVKYNQTTPPVYKIEDFKMPVAFWTGGRDIFVEARDTEMLSPRISNLIYHKNIPEWQHLDFIWGLDASEKMFMDIIEIMKKYL